MSHFHRPAGPNALAVVLALGSFIGPLIVILPLISSLEGYAFTAGGVVAIALGIAAWRADRSAVLHGAILWSVLLWGGTGIVIFALILVD